MRLASTSILGFETPYTFFARMPNRAMPSTFRRVPKRRSSAKQSRQVHRRRWGDLREGLKRFVGIEEDGDRAFIDQLHRHHSLKQSRGYGDAYLLQSLTEGLVKGPSPVGRCSGDKAGPAAAARIAIEGELRDDQCRAFHV